MDMLSTIKTPIEQELAEFKSFFTSLLKSDVELLDSALSYVAESVGKSMRPILTLLVAKSIGKVCENTYSAAAVVELLHTASLLHDDVIDESDKRRGRESLNVRYNNNVAVLAGDYLFSLSLSCAAKTRDVRVIDQLARIGKDLPDGEVLQIELQRNGTYSEENYFRAIYYKTASLFVSCCASGVYTGGGDDALAEAFCEYGKYAGICFQIKDDIFDYYNNDIGKPTGSDMIEGKITLPALYVLRTSSNPLLQPIRKKLESGIYLDEKEVETLLDISRNEGGVEYAKECIANYRSKAIEALPDGISDEFRNAFIAYIDYVITRDK